MDPNERSFEWWYFDAQFSDGSTAVVVFKTKDYTNLDDPLTPIVSLTITRPDGSEWNADVHSPVGQFHAAEERCDVQMGSCWARGDLHIYTIHGEAVVNGIDLTFTGEVPAWVPETDPIYFDAEQKQFFGWVPSIPFGTVTGTLTYDGQSHQVSGTGYHDHNWGNVPMQDGISRWYWGRAHVDEFSTIFVMIYFRPDVAKAIRRESIPIFLLAKGGSILTGEGAPLHMKPSAMLKTPAGIAYPGRLEADWRATSGSVQLTVTEPKIIQADDLLASVPSWLRYFVKWFTHPYYLRFNANLEMRVDLDGIKAETRGQTLFEQMSFE
jgi:CrtC N-terminal lipocalin domain